METALPHYAPPPDSRRVREQALAGLRAPAKYLPFSLLYDEAGSHLFERITRLPEYYLTRTETSILTDSRSEIHRAIGRQARVVELGSGSGNKTRILLQGLGARDYTAIDISRTQLTSAARRIALEFPGTKVRALCLDYTRPFALPPAVDVNRTVIFFPGSTIGNFEPLDAEVFLRRIRMLVSSQDGLLVGVDLVKDRDILERAYNDRAGITARFNLNLLTRLNREAGADFDPLAFEHSATYNDASRRIEMGLISRRDQIVAFPKHETQQPETIHFRVHERVVSEHCYKYSVAEFAALAHRAGWSLQRTWKDTDRLFAVLWLEAGLLPSHEVAWPVA